MKLCICTPTIRQPHPKYLEALEASVPALDAEGWEHVVNYEIGSPYISHARSKMLRRALDAKADVIVFIDHDLSWTPESLVKLIKTPGWMVAGTYRYKISDRQLAESDDPCPYMGRLLPTHDGRPWVREDGAIKAQWMPAGFLKVTHEAVDLMMRRHPELIYGPLWAPYFDLFNHGARNGTWFGEDYAASQRWIEAGKDLWCVPDLDLTHWDDNEPYVGNYHFWLSQQPGGANDPAKLKASASETQAEDLKVAADD